MPQRIYRGSLTLAALIDLRKVDCRISAPLPELERRLGREHPRARLLRFLGEVRPEIASAVAHLEREALEQLRAAAYGDGPCAVQNAELLGHVDPRVLAQLFLAALGRGDHPDSETNPVYALYQVALDYRCSAETRQSLADIAEVHVDQANKRDAGQGS